MWKKKQTKNNISKSVTRFSHKITKYDLYVSLVFIEN